ncbi:MAG: hypothetical protein RL308_1313 [Bacteroidota bacterium]|jgi:hypothetical protein
MKQAQMSVKITNGDYIQLEELRVYLFKNKGVKLSKRALLAWIISKAKNEIIKK